jgi:GGDEF domain-containing protein
LPPGTDTDEWEIDPVSGLLRERHLPVVLQQAVASARRKVQPVAVVFWELDELHEAPEETRDEAVTALGAVAWRTLREADSVFRLGDVAAVAVLADTAEPGAVLVAERVAVEPDRRLAHRVGRDRVLSHPRARRARAGVTRGEGARRRPGRGPRARPRGRRGLHRSRRLTSHPTNRRQSTPDIRVD